MIHLSRSSRLAAITTLLALAGCGREEEQTPVKAKKAEPVATQDHAPAAKTDLGTVQGDTEADLSAVEDDDWGDDTGGEKAPEQPAETPEQPATDTAPQEAQPFVGPCKIRWSTGAVLRFKYTDQGGTVRVDEDGDGKSDTCGKFTITEGKTTRVEIDQGCDRSTDSTIEPIYDEKANVATATFTEKVEGKSTKRSITLVTMAGFTGLTPGYPIYAKRKQAKVRVRDGLVRSIDVKSPWEGPALKATFFYDAKGRIKRINEDFDADKTTDRRFDYRYDNLGNITRMKVAIGSGEAQQKGSALLSYACFAPQDDAKKP